MSQVSQRAEAFPHSARVTKRFEYRRIQNEGRKVHAPHFLFFVVKRADESSVIPSGARLGVTVTKKIATAVGRNRVKRLLRDVFRRRRTKLPPWLDVVAIAKDGAAELSLEQVEREMDLISRALRSAS